MKSPKQDLNLKKVKILKKITKKPRGYEEFCRYICTIVLYQATNKKFKSYSIRRKATLNMTLRQISKVTRIPRETVRRYINRMKKEGLLVFSQKKDSNIKGHNSMIFYYIPQIIHILKAKAKKRVYKIYSHRLEALKNGPLKISFLQKLKKKQFHFLPSYERPSFFFRFDEKFEDLSQIDLRKNPNEVFKFLEKEKSIQILKEMNLSRFLND